MPFKIHIAQKLTPFSHTSWFRSVIPRTTCLAEVFPTALHIQEWQGSTYKTLFKLTGPIKGFTVQLDAQKGHLRVFGQAKEGPFSYLLFARESALYIYLEKGPLPFPIKMKHHLMDLKAFQTEMPKERLSLGMHRKQEWDQVIRRGDFKEIFPTWLALGSMLPATDEKGGTKEGNYSLLSACRSAIEKGDKLKVLSPFENLFAAGFSCLLAPLLNDPRFLGLSIPTRTFLSPLPLLSKSAELIRSLFFQEEGKRLALLPLLPPQFHAGRFLNIQTAAGDSIDLEWTKKLLRRAIIRPGKTRAVQLELQKALKTFRIRKGKGDSGCVVSASDPLKLTEGVTLYLDRFQK